MRVLVVGGSGLSHELVADLELILATPVTSLVAEGASVSEIAALLAEHGPENVVFAVPSFATDTDPGVRSLIALTRMLEATAAVGIDRFVTITSGAAAQLNGPVSAIESAAERLTVGFPHNVVRFEPGAKGADALMEAALDPAQSEPDAEQKGLLITGPGILDDGTISPELWGPDEIFVPGRIAGVWQTRPAPLSGDAVAPAVVAATDGDYGPLMALVTPPEPAAAMTVLLSTPVVAGREHELVSATLDSGWLAPAGPQLDQFEADLAAWVDDQAVVALSSGSAGLHLALAVAGVQPGDEVVVQTATFAASAFAVHHAGAIPVFCDIDEVTANLDPDLLAEKLTERARRGRLPAAVVSVDLYGYCADYQRLKQVCQEFGVPLIQDAAESLGSRAAGQAAGAHGELGVLSFNGNKIITTSGGGALTGPRELVERARKLSTQAREPGLHYEHQEIGYNYRLSGLLASVGTAQLETLEDRITRKTALHDRYVEALPRLDWFPTGVTEVWNHWLSVARLPRELPPHLACRHLAAAGIEARPFWKPMHRQPIFAQAEAWITGPSDTWYASGICLPSGYSLTNEAQDLVIEVLASFLDH